MKKGDDGEGESERRSPDDCVGFDRGQEKEWLQHSGEKWFADPAKPETSQGDAQLTGR